MVKAVFPAARHDHGRCIAALLSHAERVCADRNARLTRQRRDVLRTIVESHAAIGAYEIIDRLADDGRRPAPITVYRVLDFLIKLGLVHRLASLNAYVACAHPGDPHGAQFLICEGCGAIGELCDRRVCQAIDGAAHGVGFRVSSPVVEIAGVCENCRRHGARRAAAV